MEKEEVVVEKKLILAIGDLPTATSGIAHQMREFMFALLNTGRYKVIALGGAIKHQQYNPIKTEEFGDDFIILPVDGYGNPDILRSLIWKHKPDVLWYMSDPRFYGWLHSMSDEILPLLPMIWYAIWDNYPIPKFNAYVYKSNSYLACISKLTHDIVTNIAPEIESCYFPHAVNTDIFKKLPEEDVAKIKQEHFGSKFVFFFNSRNARRKQTGSLIYWFKQFIDKHDLHGKCVLLMHTEPGDPNGPDLVCMLEDWGLTDGSVVFSTEKVPAEHLAMFYNMSDCGVLLSDAEGFGLFIIESLACETPVIATLTGGIQDQIIDTQTGQHFGIGLEPASKTIAGSQEVPYIFEDRLSEAQVVEAFEKMYFMNKSDREKLGKLGRKNVLKNFDYKDFQNKWIEVMDYVVETNGSWDTRKGFKPWNLIKL